MSSLGLLSKGQRGVGTHDIWRSFRLTHKLTLPLWSLSFPTMK